MYTYFGNFPLPRYSAVSILNNNLYTVNQIILFYEKNNFKIFKLKFYKKFIVQENLK